MSRFLALCTVTASLALALSSCGDSSNSTTAGPLTGAGGGASGAFGDGAVATGGAPAGDGQAPGNGGSSQGGASQGGSSQGGASQGGSSQGGASTGTGGVPPVACATDGDCASPLHCVGGFCAECAGDANCPNGETCNTATHKCVECATSGDCPNTSPYCDPDGRCVDCLTNDNCVPQNPGPGAPTLVCNQQSHSCVPGCTESSQCQTPFGGARVCDTSTNQCVQCVTTADCNVVDAGRPVICTPQHTCTPGCADDTDCAGNPTRRHCNTTTSLCIQCGTSADCGQQAPYCFTDTGMCVACLTDANCANSGGVCNQQFHLCGCTQNSDCGQGQQCFRGQCF